MHSNPPCKPREQDMRGRSTQKALQGVHQAPWEATQDKRLSISDGKWSGALATPALRGAQGSSHGVWDTSLQSAQSLTASRRKFGVCSGCSTGPGHYAVWEVDLRWLQGVSVSTRGYDAKRATQPFHKHTQIRDVLTGHRRRGGKCVANTFMPHVRMQSEADVLQGRANPTNKD